jgi:hypothetical protein
MFKFHHKLALAAFLVAAGLLGITKPAAAGIEIDYSIDGGARTFGNSSAGSSVTYSNTSLGGLFNVTFSIGSTNTPGTGTLATETQGNNLVSTLYTTGSHTLHIYVSSTDFTSPQSPPPTILGNTSSITELAGATDVTFTSYASTSNTLFATSGGVTSSTGYSYSVTGQQSSGGAGFSSTFFSPDGAKYSLTNIGDYRLAAGTDITIVGGNTKVTPTPVPAGMVLALSGLPVLGLGYWFRRRQVRLAPVA